MTATEMQTIAGFLATAAVLTALALGVVPDAWAAHKADDAPALNRVYLWLVYISNLSFYLWGLTQTPRDDIKITIASIVMFALSFLIFQHHARPKLKLTSILTLVGTQAMILLIPLWLTRALVSARLPLEIFNECVYPLLMILARLAQIAQHLVKKPKRKTLGVWIPAIFASFVFAYYHGLRGEWIACGGSIFSIALSFIVVGQMIGKFGVGWLFSYENSWWARLILPRANHG